MQENINKSQNYPESNSIETMILLKVEPKIKPQNSIQNTLSNFRNPFANINIEPKRFLPLITYLAINVGVLLNENHQVVLANNFAQQSEKNKATNTEKIIKSSSESNNTSQFVKNIFEKDGNNANMKNGGTPRAIKHALESEGGIAYNNAPQYIMESIKINNGPTNKLNLILYKTQIKKFMINIEQGYTPTEAFLKSAVDCAKQNPNQIKSPTNDLETLQNVAIKIREDCIDNQVDSSNVINDTQKNYIKNELKKSKYITPLEQNNKLLKLIAENKLPQVAPSIKDSKPVKESMTNNTNLQNSPKISTEQKIENTVTKPSVEQKESNQSTIADSLFKLGLLGAIGAAAFAGIKNFKIIKQKLSSLLKVNFNDNNEIIKSNFNKNMETIKKENNRTYDSKSPLTVTQNNSLSSDIADIESTNLQNSIEENIISQKIQPESETNSNRLNNTTYTNPLELFENKTNLLKNRYVPINNLVQQI